MSKLKDLKDTLKLLKHSKPKPVFCPKCRSSNISSEALYGVLPSLYTCKDCGYNGPIVLELDEAEEPEKV